MNRLAYRNFGSYDALVVNVLNSGTQAATRWYEIRNVALGSAYVYHQGSYAPVSRFRWMGSIAQDHQGNMAIGTYESERESQAVRT